MMGHEIRTPVDLLYGRPEDELVESYPSFVQGLQENLNVVHEFARKKLGAELRTDGEELQHR